MDNQYAKMFVRSLTNSSAKIVMAFMFARTALDVQELREWTGLKRETIYDGLEDLRALGKLERQTLAHGRHVWLPAGDLLPGFQMSEKGTPEIQMSEKRTPELPDVQISDTTTLIEGGGLINSESVNLIPSSLNDQESEKRTSELPDVVEILQHTDLLFDGALVVSRGLEDRDSRYALAWCAYAYRERSKLNGAGGLVRNRLLENKVPPEWAQERWQETLPCDFLEALGLIEYTCEVCSQKFRKLADLDEHARIHPGRYPCDLCEQTFASQEDLDAHADAEHAPQPIVPDESVTQPVRDGGITPAQAWQSVLGQLQLDMPRAAFDTWVRDAQAVRYGRNTLTIGVRNAYARDWLESRLASTVSRLLVGILNASVQVEFVVAEVPA